MDEKTHSEKRSTLTALAERLQGSFPDLRLKLALADINKTPAQFLETVILVTIQYSALLLFLLVLGIIAIPLSPVLILPGLLIIPFFMFNYWVRYPQLKAIQRKREMDYEILFAGRHIGIALKSGMPLFNSLVGVSKGYGEVSKEFNRVVDQIALGKSTADTLRDVAQNNPSRYFTRITVQIANSLTSGANVADSLEAVLDQISREQVIQLKEYGSKLTPFVMFFMIFGIILPVIGIVLATVLLSVISGGKLGISGNILWYVLVMVGIVQFLFLGLIESSRPKFII